MYTRDLETTQKVDLDTTIGGGDIVIALLCTEEMDRFTRNDDGDMKSDESAATRRLAVEQIPTLVREVDLLMQTFETTSFSTKSSETWGQLIQRADEAEAFCKFLEPGPLQEMVDKQVTRLRDAAQCIQLPSRRLNRMGIEKPRMRPVPIRVTPFMGSTLARAAAKVGLNAKKQVVSSERRIGNKPLYRWEKRRFLRGSTVVQPNVATMKTNVGRKPIIAEKRLDEGDGIEVGLHPCSEPGHYSQSSFQKTSSVNSNSACFEFQIILTEDEFKTLKFQKRRIEAEQRHLSRRNKSLVSGSVSSPPALTASILERKKFSQ